MAEPSQLSRSRRPKWHYVAMGVVLIVVAVALTVAWQILAAPDSAPSGVGTARAVAYFFGSLLFMLLIGGLVLIVILLLREVRLNERQSNFVSAVTHELKTPVASLRLYLDGSALEAAAGSDDDAPWAEEVAAALAVPAGVARSGRPGHRARGACLFHRARLNVVSALRRSPSPPRARGVSAAGPIAPCPRRPDHLSRPSFRADK